MVSECQSQQMSCGANFICCVVFFCLLQQSELKKATVARKPVSPHDKSAGTSPSANTTGTKPAESHVTSPVKSPHQAPARKPLCQRRSNSPRVSKPPRILSGNQTTYGDKENVLPRVSLVNGSQNSHHGWNDLCLNSSHPQKSFGSKTVSECEIIDVLAVDKREELDDGADSDLSAIARRIAAYELYGDEGELEEENRKEAIGER